MRLYEIQKNVPGSVIASTGSTSRPPQPLNGRVVKRVCQSESRRNLRGV